MEVILTEVKISRFIPLLIASVCGQLVALVLLGEDILFSFKLTESFVASETGFYLLFGALCGMISLYFTRIMFMFEGGIKKLKNDFGRAAVGGVCLALIILTFPPIYGEGYETIKSLLNGDSADIFHHSLFIAYPNIKLHSSFSYC